ncbi:MAG: ribosome silencing factor [Thermodesulfobacteriota bacterium]
MTIETEEKALLCARAAWDKKAENITVIKVKELSDFADYFVICSADNSRGTKAIADNIQKVLKESKIKAYGLEGYTQGKWILLDTIDIVVHIFYEPLRDFYDLEGLWIDAPRIKLSFEMEAHSQAVQSVK